MNRWLATRLAAQVPDKSASDEGRPPKSSGSKGGLRKQVELPRTAPGAKPRARVEDPDGEDAATRPGAPTRHSTPLGQGMFGPAARHTPSLDDDPVTVRADRRAVMKALAEVDSDPATVQRFGRLPMSFAGESEKDPATVFDQDNRWRDDLEAEDQGHIDEVPPGRLPPGPSFPSFQERSSPTLAREIPIAPRDRPTREPGESRVTVLIPLLAGAAGGMLILALVMAWLAGSP